MANYLDLPIEILDKINGYVIHSKNKDVLSFWFNEWKEQVSYYVKGKRYIVFYNNAKLMS